MALVLNVTFFVLVILAVPLMAVALGYAVRMGVGVRKVRSGRILFGNLAAAELWVVVYLLYVIAAIYAPELFDATGRAVIRILFALYLVVQSLTTIVSLRRLRIRGEE